VVVGQDGGLRAKLPLSGVGHGRVSVRGGDVSAASGAELPGDDHNDDDFVDIRASNNNGTSVWRSVRMGLF
jgi:hypothetical protein